MHILDMRINHSLFQDSMEAVRSMYMKYRALTLATALLMGSSVAMAGPEAGDRSLTLSGNGTSDKDFDNNTFGVSGQMGWFTSDHLEVGFRQSLNGAATDGDDPWSGSTRVFADYHFTDEGLIPFVGANVGGIYGEDVDTTGSAGLEAGLKYYVKEKTFISFMGEYQFLFDDTDDVDEQFDDGAFLYNLGIGFNF